MELLVALGAGVLIIVLLIAALAIWRIGRVVSWRALAMTARATGSFAECVAFIRFCAQRASESREMSHFEQRHGGRVIPRNEESRRFWRHRADSRRYLASSE